MTIFKNMFGPKKLLLRFLILVIVFFLKTGNVCPSTFDSVSIQFPENTEIRRTLYEKMTGSNKDALSALPEWVVIENTGVRVNFFTKKVINSSGANIYFCFSHGAELDFTRGTKGSYIIRRSLDKFDNINYGINQIKIFYKNNDNSFIRINPAEDSKESLMEIQLYGRVMQNNIKVPLTLAELSKRSFSELANLTSNYVDWSFYISDYRKLYGDDVRALSETINPLLNYLRDKDDGAIDQAGNFVYINTLADQNGVSGLNCSGFVKWIIDGIYKPVVGKNIDIGFLKEKHYNLRGNKWSKKLENTKDPYFGLDWTRNLAYEVLKLKEPEAVLRAVDVNRLRYDTYLNNIGYPINNIKTDLYELAMTSPHYFYLGSLNSKSNDPPYLREHTHVLALFPYIDRKGDFHAVVYSRNKSISLDYLKSHWKDNFIHLVRIKASPRFEPSGIDFNPVLRR